MLLPAILSFALLGVVLLLAAYPFLEPGHAEATRAPDSEDQDLERLLGSIAELDMDHATGKLSDSDHQAMRSRSVAEAAALMKSTRDDGSHAEAAGAPDTDPSAALNALLESEVAARKAALLTREAERAAPDDAVRVAAGAGIVAGAEAPAEEREEP